MKHPACIHRYNSPEFININRHKTGEIIEIDIKSGDNIKAHITLGKSGDALKSPFSAPFGGPDFDEHLSFTTIESLITELKSIAKDSGLPVEITLPPLFYNNQLSKLAGALLLRDDTEVYADINYHIDLTNFESYEATIPRSARKNLRQSSAHNLTTLLIDSDDDARATVYDLMQRNRAEKGRELKMSFSQLTDTSRIIPVDFFLMKSDDTPVAGAICYHVAEGIVQVIYWGHLSEYSAMRPMNRLAYDIFLHYHREGIRIVDIGPASIDGVPDPGLCDFKENIGSVPSLKYHFTIQP